MGTAVVIDLVAYRKKITLASPTPTNIMLNSMLMFNINMLIIATQWFTVRPKLS